MVSGQGSAPSDAGTESAVHGLSPGRHEFHEPIVAAYNLHHIFSPNFGLWHHTWNISWMQDFPSSLVGKQLNFAAGVLCKVL